jgi:hypothetical protein
MKTFVGKCLFESKGQAMNVCVESEGEVAKVLQKEIIHGDPLDNACVFWQEIYIHCSLWQSINPI